MTIRIICINKDNGNHSNKHEGITRFGWLEESTGRRGFCSRSQMVEFIEEKGNSAYVAESGNKAYLYVRISVKGYKFVQTIADKKYSDNLLALIECRG